MISLSVVISIIIETFNLRVKKNWSYTMPVDEIHMMKIYGPGELMKKLKPSKEWLPEHLHAFWWRSSALDSVD